MSVTAIVGANWGDEGKGKMVDIMAAEADMVVRFQGGSNAGHTIINDYGKFALHLLPAGVFYPHTVNMLGPGVALNVHAFTIELDILKERGVPTPDIRISDRAQLVMPYHLLLDEYEENRRGAQAFGSTRQGIAPFYADKYSKVGVQVADLKYPDRMKKQIEGALATKNVLFEHLYDQPSLSADKLVDEMLEAAQGILPFVDDTVTLIHDALSDGKHILLEGQLGALRDPDHGIYPYPTSSSPLAGFASVGAGIPPSSIQQVLTVTKAYSSCVGTGPFVTELQDPEAQELRNRGGDAGEYGATTGRPRRVGWFDVVATRYGCRIQGATEVVLTNLDVLGYLDTIPVCFAYETGSERTESFPPPAQLDQAKPVLTSLPGWRQDVAEVRTFQDLPAQAQQYVLQLEEWIGIPITWIGVGPRRDQIIQREKA
ncbi:MAG: adenylosuccinate synthase [Candidatus Latescibacteria bacterium]|nr:adenylosuccinate synthase [Candidatus Latescibacterota bacterium]MDP7237068.1 adenylosuccinate synthase [Candidatus Latescibacterota bacterium]